MRTLTIREVVEGPHHARRAKQLAKALRQQEGCEWVRVEPWRHSRRTTVTAGSFPWPEGVSVVPMPDGCSIAYG